MVLCPLSVELRPLNLSGESLKVGIDDVGGRQLLVVVLKGELVLTIFRHLHPHRCLAYLITVGSVFFQQILPCVAMLAALAEVLAVFVLALGKEQAVKVFDPGEVMLTGFLDQQKIDSGYCLRLGAESVNIHARIPAKYVNGQVIQLLHFGDLRDGRGASIPLKFRSSLVGYIDGLSTWS